MNAVTPPWVKEGTPVTPPWHRGNPPAGGRLAPGGGPYSGKGKVGANLAAPAPLRPEGAAALRLPSGSPAERAIAFLQTLKIPEGPKADEPLTLAPFQEQFVNGALHPDNNIAVLSIGRGNAKTAISAGLGLGALLGVWDEQPKREILIAARTRDQAAIAFNFAVGFLRTLPEEVQAQVIVRRSPRLELELRDATGPHMLRAISADGKTALGSAPTLVLMDERGHWSLDQGNDLEHALLSGLGKRGGRALIISTSASTDMEVLLWKKLGVFV